MIPNSRVLALVALLGSPLLFPACSTGAEDAAASSTESGEAPTTPAAPAVDLARADFTVDGMTCGGCVLGVRTALKRLDGVAGAEVSYEDATAVVTFDPEKVDTEAMIAAVGELGYTATLVGVEVRT